LRPTSNGTDPPDEGRSTAAKAVDAAYRVVESYVEEGRRHADGRSAWFGAPGRGVRASDSARDALDTEALLELWRLVEPFVRAAGGLTAVVRAMVAAARAAGIAADPSDSMTEPRAAEPSSPWAPWTPPPHAEVTRPVRAPPENARLDDDEQGIPPAQAQLRVTTGSAARAGVAPEQAQLRHNSTYSMVK
jgi:hypothetical protein